MTVESPYDGWTTEQILTDLEDRYMSRYPRVFTPIDEQDSLGILPASHPRISPEDADRISQEEYEWFVK